jgi:hypothetical protein
MLAIKVDKVEGIESRMTLQAYHLLTILLDETPL